MYKNAQNLRDFTPLEVCSSLLSRALKKHNNNIENHLSVFSFIGICINNTKESMIQTLFFFDKLGLSFVLLNSHLSEIISQAYSINKIAGIWYGVSTESAHIKFLCFPIRIEISSTAFEQKI